MRIREIELAEGHYTRPKIRKDDGRWVFRASSFGSCVKLLWLESRGSTPAPMGNQVRADEGRRLEDEIVRRAMESLEEMGVKEVSLSPAFELSDGGWAITCTPDRIASLGSVKVPIEVKLLTKPKVLGNALYRWQFAIECASLGAHEGFWITAENLDGEIGEVTVHRLLTPYHPDSITERARMLTEMLSGDMPECDDKTPFCGFWDFHTDGVWKVEDAGEEWVPKIEEYRRVCDQLDVLGKRKQQLRDELFDGLGVGKRTVGGFVVTLSEKNYPESTITRKAYMARTVTVKELAKGGDGEDSQ